MANCHDCWWADYNKDAPERHVVHEEPDYLQMKSAFAAPPMVRIVKSCHKGKHYFSSAGAQDHSCAAFLSYSYGEKNQARLDKAKSRKWKYRTVRTRLPKSGNILVLITTMCENDNTAYDILFSAMEHGQDVISWLILDLDDMNIRGAQIPIAYDYAGGDIARLCHLAKCRSTKMVKHINAVSTDHSEEAVARDARAYGHKVASKPRKLVAHRPEVVAVDSGRRKVVIKRRLRG